MSGLLFITAEADHQRRVLREQGRGYWTAALPLVLEKHGFAALTTAGPEALDGLGSGDWDVVLVGRLPEEAWTGPRIDALRTAACQVLLEGPLPAAVGILVGITDEAPVDTAQMTISVTDAAVASAARAYGEVPGGRLGPSQSRPVDRDADRDWTVIDAVPLTLEQAWAWRKPGWDAAATSVAPDVEVLATLLPEGATTTPAIIRRGVLHATTFSLFAALGQMHTSEPWDGAEYRNSQRSTGLEHALLGVLDVMHARAGVVRHRLLPWPRGGEWVLNVRHDFDRFLTAERVDALLRRHDEVGTVATWYWRSRHLVSSPARRPWLLRRRRDGVAAIRAVADHPTHEVALHTEQLWLSATAERRTLERAIGGPVLGTCSHGDPTCFRFQGAPNVLWAERQGLSYTELIQHAHYHPHRFPALDPDGTIRTVDVICLPHHESFDRTMEPGGSAAERIQTRTPVFERIAGMLQVMNHPDIHNDDLFETLATLPSGGRLNWTAARTAEWWRSTHTLDRLRLEPRRDGGCDVVAQDAVENVIVEALAPDGTRRRTNVSVGGAAGVT